jgi:hypothetical protein
MENEVLQSINLMGASLTSAYALTNREGKIKNFVDKINKKVGSAYRKASPFIEHAVWGYALTSLGYFAQENEGIKNFMLNQYPNSPTEQYGLIAGASAVGGDLAWESKQAIERKKIKPSQFVGTCIGSLAAILVNNSDKINL